MNIQKSGVVLRRVIGLRAALMITTTLTILSFVTTPAHAANWTGATGDWFDPSNWDSAVPTSGTDAIINNGGTAQVQSPGAVSSSGSIGGGTGTSGTVDVSGAGSSWALGGGLDIGFQGDGTLNISDGATVSNTNTTLGGLNGSSGNVTVDGEGSHWTNTYFTVGNDGEGTLDISGGGTVQSTGSSIGFGTGRGGVTVDGAGSTWSTFYTLTVGYDGDATLDISNGGTVTSQSGYVGYQAGSLGGVTVDGEDSAWNVDSDLVVGNEGEGTLDITNGGMVRNVGGTIASEVDSTGAVTVDGEGSTWTNSSGLMIGRYGEGTLNITNGGAVSNTDGHIGYYASGTGTVTVDGEGSTWTNTRTLTIGYDGEGTLDITDGGVVSGVDVNIGYLNFGIGTVTVDGDGSKLTSTGSLYVGDYFSTGTLNITGGGAVSSGNTYTGFSGTITVDGAGSTWTNRGNLYLGYDGTGSLTISNGASVSLNGLAVATADGSVATINIGAAMGETAVAAGALHVTAIEFGIGTGNLVFNHTDADYELASDISGSGVISQIGSGSTTLSGNSSGFTGTTSVDDGALIVNGSLGGSMSVGAARLGGSGSVGNLTLGNGSVIAPGSSAGTAGTLSVLGDLTFNAGSTYEVEVNPASADNDLIHVSGTAYLNDASVKHVGLSGTYPWYMSQTILTADTGISGAFGSVTSDYAFLTPDLSYDAHNVRMTLLRNDIEFAEVATSPNQQGVAGAATMLGLGNPIYDEIVTMTAEQAQAAFEALSGEAYSSEGTAAFNAAQQLRDVLQARLQVLASGSKIAGMTYAPAAGDAPTGDAPAVWGQVFGSWGVNDASATTAKLERRSSGFLGGADKAIGEDSRIGVALGYSHSDFDVSSLSSSSESDNFHLAGYAGTKLSVFDLGGNISYSYGRADARRTVIVGGLTNNLSGDYDTHTVQASVEAGVDMDLTEVVVTSFAGLAGTYVRTDSFTETGGPAALAIDASDNVTGVSSLGLRVRREAGHVALIGSAAWRHAFGDVAPASRFAFASAPAASFIVRGAPVAEDTLAVGAHIDLSITDGTKLTFGYAGEFASDVRDHGLRSELRVEF